MGDTHLEKLESYYYKIGVSDDSGYPDILLKISRIMESFKEGVSKNREEIE